MEVGEMKIDVYKDILVHDISVSIVPTEADFARSKISRAIREWYRDPACKHTASDEVFYLSEIIKGLGRKMTPLGFWDDSDI
ncbi:MAG: hypothetical protein LUQ47_06600 [Methanotrichaceae archaeon]|nr:hypothetical protein [Methanotrichaceae archaeon]